MTDDQTLAALIQACRDGDDDAWRELLERIAPLVFSVCRDNRLSQEESLDIFGQVCYVLVTNIDKVRSAARIFSYVGTITRRQIYDRYHKEHRFSLVPADELAGHVGDVDEGPDQLFGKERQRRILLQALASLSRRDYRLIYALFFDHREPSYDEIARELNMPVASIGPTRQRALKKLQTILKRMGYEFEVF